MFFKRTRNFQPLFTALVLSVALFATLFTEPALAQGKSDVPVTEAEANKAVTLKRFEAYNQRNLYALDEVFTVDSYDHDPIGGDAIGREARKGFMAGFLAIYPDAHWTVDDIVAGGDFVAARITLSGTLQETGLPWVVTGIVIDRFVDGKIAETWTEADYLGAAQQTGEMPGMRESYEWGEPSEVTGDPGDPEANKTIVLRFAEELWNQKNLDVADEIFTTDIITHNPVDAVSGLEAVKENISKYLTAFPDFHVDVDIIFAEGDKVATYWTASATHGGELMGIPATENQMMWTGITMYRFADGKIVETWWSYDALGMMLQIQQPPKPDTEANKALVRRRYDEIWNQKSLSVADEIQSDNYVYHDPDGNLDHDGRKQLVAMYLAAFPDLHWTVEDQIAEGDMVVTRLTATER